MATKVCLQALPDQLVRLFLLVWPHVTQHQALHRESLPMIWDLSENLVGGLDGTFVLLFFIELNNLLKQRVLLGRELGARGCAARCRSCRHAAPLQQVQSLRAAGDKSIRQITFP
jgi:hypothetical protein